VMPRILGAIIFLLQAWRAGCASSVGHCVGFLVRSIRMRGAFDGH
jgi:hypothetical protein